MSVLEESPYRIQPSQRSLELTSDTSFMQHSPRDRYCSLLFIFTFYLLLSICLSIGLSYKDIKRVSLHNIGFTKFSDQAAWKGLKGGEHCLRYATREYTARLSTNAIGKEAMKACKETPTEIHGRLVLTDFCQDLGLGRGIWGFWIVNVDEPACQTTWNKFVDHGCVESFRHIEAHLDNLQIGADWRIMCATTPADIYGQHFFSPTECFHLGKLGVFGTWDLQDTSCDD